jgi:regulatory Fis family protein
MEPVAQLAAVLVAPDPRGAAEHALTYLMGVHGAASGAVLALKQGILIPYTIREMETRRLEEVQRAWVSWESGLRGGDVVQVDDLVLYALHEGGTLLGAVVLAGAVHPVREDLLQTFGLALAKAIAVAPPPGVLPGLRPGPVPREELLLNLSRHEWNIARVARMMGVTRRTIYLRLRRYGIHRVRIPKMKVREAVT